MDTKLYDLLTAAEFRFNKALGQNFITDINLLNGIVNDSGASENDIVVEIGTGAGTLTRQLATKCKKVFSFEVDENLKPVLELSLQGLENVEVIFRDVLKMSDRDITEIIGDMPFKVVANLPYYITTPLIMRFIESSLPVLSLTVMVQEEMGKRLVAKPNTADYAAITLAVLSRGEGKIMRKVSRKVFVPEPNVDSVVIRIDVDDSKLEGEDKALIHRLIRAAFAMRRKTLVNNLSVLFGISKADAEKKIIDSGLMPMVRGEALSLEDYIRLSKQFAD